MNWTPDERRIYAWTDHAGVSQRSDPLVLWRALTEATGGKLDAMLEDQHVANTKGRDPATPPDDAAQLRVILCRAEAALADAGLKTFGLPRYDSATNAGATEADALRLLDEFLSWCEAGKVPAGTPATT